MKLIDHFIFIITGIAKYLIVFNITPFKQCLQHAPTMKIQSEMGKQNGRR